MSVDTRRPWLVVAALLAPVALAQPARAGEPVLVEFHYTPVPNVQMAIWLEDKDGQHALDVLVTQATGKYGIGNRPGRWDFLSSWRAPYGPRPSVLPIWAHRRGASYPRIVFFEDDPDYFDSLGWHETTSSAESYFCIPLTPEQNEVVVDSMTCPSPKNFSTDKGRFDPEGGQSPYPPRNDLIAFEPFNDSPDAMSYSALNDLDAVTAATPIGDKGEFTAFVIPADVAARGPLTAYAEVSLEHDENSHYDYDRDNDHWVDPLLSVYGVEYLGQPSVVYKVSFDPAQRGFVGVTDYAGYGDWNGATGTIHPPDDTISQSGGSGADRLKITDKNGDTFRWGVYSYGVEGPVDTTTGGGSSGGESGSGGDSDTGGGTGGGWGGLCDFHELTPVEELHAEALAFDRVRLTFTIPEQADTDFQLYGVTIRHVTGDDITWTPEVFDAAHEVPPIDLAGIAPPGAPTTLEVAQLWGDYTYHFAVAYEDHCTNRSALATTSLTTPAQKFQTVDTFCFVATAAYGVPWAPQVAALRAFRDAYLKTSATGVDLVRFYYGYSPPLARVIQGEPLLRGLARVVLQPVADAARLATAPTDG